MPGRFIDVPDQPERPTLRVANPTWRPRQYRAGEEAIVNSETFVLDQEWDAFVLPSAAARSSAAEFRAAANRVRLIARNLDRRSDEIAPESPDAAMLVTLRFGGIETSTYPTERQAQAAADAEFEYGTSSPHRILVRAVETGEWSEVPIRWDHDE